MKTLSVQEALGIKAWANINSPRDSDTYLHDKLDRFLKRVCSDITYHGMTCKAKRVTFTDIFIIPHLTDGFDNIFTPNYVTHFGLVTPYGIVTCSSLVRVITFCLSATSYYLIQCWLIVIWPCETKFSGIFNHTQYSSLNKMYFKISSEIRRPFCLGLNALMAICIMRNVWFWTHTHVWCTHTRALTALIKTQDNDKELFIEKKALTFPLII